MKTVKNFSGKGDTHCLKKMFSPFAIPLNIVHLVQAHWKYNSGPCFWHRRHFIFADIDSERRVSWLQGRSLQQQGRYSGCNEDSSDEISCSSDDQSDCRGQEYDDFDGTSGRPNRSSTFLLKSMIIDVKILAADFMFPLPWRPVFSLSKAPKLNSRPQNRSHVIAEKMITGQPLVVLPPPKIFHVFTH